MRLWHYWQLPLFFFACLLVFATEKKGKSQGSYDIAKALYKYILKNFFFQCEAVLTFLAAIRFIECRVRQVRNDFFKKKK